MKEVFLRKKLKGVLKPGHVTSIEGAFSYGMPDLFITIPKASLWVELKVAKSKWLHFRTNQLPWMHREFVLGNDTAIMWYTKKYHVTTYGRLRYWETDTQSSYSTVKKKINPEHVISGDIQTIINFLQGVYKSNSSVYNRGNIGNPEGGNDVI